MVLAPIIAGLGIGLVGSFHCLGMCGPLALALPLKTQNKFHKFLSIAAYNLGRVFTYFLLGLLFGIIGQSFALVGYQQALSVIVGIFILIILLFGNKMNASIPALQHFHNKIKLLLTQLLQKEKNIAAYFFIGNVNGLLPCGLVYLALASAVATGAALHGGLLMMAFGLGTIPLMFLLMIAGTYFSATVRQNMRKLVPVFVGLMACILILRGLNLGIPYISPKLSQTEKGAVVQCHADSANQPLKK